MYAIPNSFFLFECFPIPRMIGLLKPLYMNEIAVEHSILPCSLNSQLRVMTLDYLEKHPTLTLNALSQRCGVPATTMRRLMQDENRSDLAPHSVLALVSYLLKEKKISALLKLVTGPVETLLKKCFDQFIFDEKTSNHELQNSLNSVFQDKMSYIIYKLAANNAGTSIEEVKDAMGLIGLKKLNDLIEKGLVYEKENSYHAKQKNFSVDLNLAHELSHALIDLYKPCDVALGYNLFYSLSEGLNDAGIKKIKEIEKEAVKKIFDVMNNTETQGAIPYFAVIVSDVIGPTPTIEQKTGVLQ